MIYKNIIQKGLVLCLVFQMICLNAQVTFSKRMKYSESASPADKSLFLIDFWATWCAPCIHVSGYLSDMQAQYPDPLYIVSLTKESPDVVEKFLKKHHTKLSVAIDYEGKNFADYQVNALPYSVMLNADGKVVWKGNPSNLTKREIERLLRKNRKTIPIYNFLNYTQYQSEKPVEISFNGDYQIDQTSDEIEDLPLISRNGKVTIVQGSLAQILCYLLKISPMQLHFNSEESQQPFRLMLKDNARQSEANIAREILSKRNAFLNKTTQKGEYYTIDFSNTSSFWNHNEIDWGDQNAKFLIDEQQFTADDISIVDMVYQLSSLRGTPFIIKNTSQKALFDWEIHYKFDNLMKNSLQNYGIKSEKTYGDYPIYKVVFK